MGTEPRRRDDAGAVAVMVAVLAALLMVTGALAVDLGNAWARKRDMQTQADVAALSAANWGKDAGLWPANDGVERSEITTKAAEYIVEANNQAIGQSATTVGQVVSALTDGDLTNGDIEFLNDGTEMRLIPPTAKVNFGLAAAVGYGSTDVTAAATVGLFSEVPGADVMPLYIPNGCSFGAVEADTTGGQGNDGGPANGDGFTFTADSTTANVGETKELTFSVARTEANRNHTPRAQFTLGDVAVEVAGTWTNTSNAAAAWTFTASIGPADVTGTNSTWTMTIEPRNNRVSAGQSFTVGTGTVVTDPDAGCSGPNQGNFGQLDSPRAGFNNATGSRGPRLEANMLHGLDHTLVPYPNPTTDSCPADGEVAQYDNAIRFGNNCIKGDRGNDGPHFASALIDGDGTTPGRLDVANGTTSALCGGRDNLDMGGNTLNNDVISCFLRNGATPAQIAQPSGVTQEMLDPSIIDSPRFVWMPVVYADDRSAGDFQPILKFVPGLITSETTTSSADAFDDEPANGDFQNGLECNGGGGNCNSVSRIKIFTFNPDALPDSADSPVVDYDADIGGETVRLVD